jgi:hypothetical protein
MPARFTPGAAVSDFERYAVARVVREAEQLGVEVPGELCNIDAAPHDGSYAARRWAQLHPDDDATICCYGSVDRPDRCTCWQPVYAVEQAPPRPPADPGDLQVQEGMCGDCAFRPGSPERGDEWMAEALYAAAAGGIPFWCHQGMRRPDHWLHPDGRRVEGSSDDWQPPIVNRIPYRADGAPGLLCAGWAAVAAARDPADG